MRMVRRIMLIINAALTTFGLITVLIPTFFDIAFTLDIFSSGYCFLDCFLDAAILCYFLDSVKRKKTYFFEKK